ncbi:sugar phosphate nucleotidyltransferase [Candidatus Pelagibacter sp.]|jgi:dTDP-glucose pyrophosphorylase|nr:sugar phosphate nucleotidyltransferase [Candidatus Pelagibacter sp.]
MSKIEKFLIFSNQSIEESIKKLNNVTPTILFIIDKSKKLIGSITDGDIRRHILKNKSLKSKVTEAANKKPIVCQKNESKKKEYFQNIILKKNIKAIPVLNKGKIEDLIFSFESNINTTPILIMAGGKGTRLMPYTANKPKPLVNINNKPILEHLIEKIKNENFQNIYISINHFGKKIKNYLETKDYFNLNIKFIEEVKPLGTAGCLFNLKKKIKNNLIIINADVITDLKLNKLLNYHNENNNQMTIGCMVHEYQIPFGVIELKKEVLKNITEKPIISSLVNAGIYVLNKKIIGTKKNKKTSMVDLILENTEKRKKIGVFPMHENWIDVGTKLNLDKAKKHLKK